jgi:hypothetical protein
VVAGAALWCAVVAVGASLVWVVVGRAGSGVLPSAEPRAAATGSLPVLRTPATRHVKQPSGPSSRHHSSSPTPSAPTVNPPNPTTTPPPTPPSSQVAPTPAAQRRSWSGRPGHVVAECRGASEHLVAAYPNTGWRYQILAKGPTAVRVRFLRLGEDHGTTVTAQCTGGVPHFSVVGGEPGDD